MFYDTPDIAYKLILSKLVPVFAQIFNEYVNFADPDIRLIALPQEDPL